jgi:hypothetical protein
VLIRLLGPDVPEDVLRALASATDHAVLRPADIHYDQAAGVATVPLRLARVTTRPWLRALGFWFARGAQVAAARSQLIIGHVTAFKADVLAGESAGDDVHLIFGVNVDGRRVYASSAEEIRGNTVFQLDIAISEIDVELTTDHPPASGQSSRGA